MLDTRIDGEKLTIFIGPECLALNSTALRENLFHTLTTSYKNICLDFSQTRFIDAAGVGVIAATVYEARRKSQSISMSGASGSVLQMLMSTGIDRLLTNKAI
ncbi:STAS domain-containing protein [Anaerospora sp.]|uniref:STAS domain-containing protein n=1 Tax=Anaerospora sp. TaxID=1960278 RepID=UPI00289CAEA9|nr:STAS domain-containing protein [Anaerospora sp.]